MRTGRGMGLRKRRAAAVLENLRLQEVGARRGGAGVGRGDGEGGKVMLETVDCCCQCREGEEGLIWGKSSAWF